MNRGRSPGTTRARSGSALALLCAASAVAWGLPAFPASAQVPPDTAPSFGTTTVVDQAYTATVDIGSLELPAATGGNGALTYALALACASGDEGTAQDCGLPSGLTFDADDRELAGTPDTPGTYRMEYKVTDADDNTAAGDADTLNFTITVATAVPGPPGNLAAEARPGTVKLTWDLPAHTGASKIIRHEYRYEVFGVDPSPWITMASSAPGGTNATSFNVGELTPARLYSFWVRAVNGAGGGPESGKVTVLTKSPEPPSGKNLNISKEFTDNPVVAGRGVGARTATLQFSVTNTHLTEDATDVKYTDNVHDMLSGATLDTSQATRALRCVRYDGTDVSGDCDNTSSENYRECGTRIWAGTTPVQIQWWDGFTVPARSTCYATDVVNIPADAATGSYVNTSGAVTGKYGETSVTGGTATDTLRVRANDQPVRVEKWFSGTRNTGILNSDGAYNHGTLEFNYQITNPNPTARARVEFTEDFTAFVERFKDFPASDLESRYTYLYLQPPEWTGCSRPTVSFPTRGQDKYGTFSFSIDPSSRIPSDNGSCTFKVRLQIPRGAETTDGIYVNAADTYTATTKSIKTTLHGNDTPLTTGDVSASVTIIKGAAWKLLQFTKAFGPPAVASAGGTVDLTYTLTNPNQQRFATDITFEHDLTEFISGAVATSVPARPCGDDSAITLENGNKRLRFSSERLHARNTCTFTVAISIPAGTNPGTYTSTTRRGSYTMEELFKGVQASVLPAISADVLVPAVPAAPTDFTAVPGDQQVTLGWTAPADTGGTDVEITGYEYSQDGGDNWTDTGATSTSHVVEALSNGTEYVFRVRARNVSGAGTPTANLEAAPRPVLTISDADVEEGNADATNMTFTVTQSATSTKPVKVEYKTADPSDASLERATAGEDYDDVSDGTLTFSANTTGDALTKTVSVKVRGDTLKENDEHFAVVLHTPDNAHIQDSEGVGKITNDDENTAPSFGTATVDDQTEVAHITMEELELPAATGGNGTLTYALACASGQTGCEDTPALPPGLSFDASTRTLSGTPKDTGTTTLTYTVTDADDITGADDTDSLTFDITVGANQPPTAVVGDGRTVAEGDTVTLDGSGSTDPEEQPLTYAWTAPEAITLSDDTAAMPTFDAPEVDGDDDYTFTLVVDDGVQDSAVASVTITVEDDTAPSFGTDVDDQAEVEHIAMEALELPAATAGNGTLTYALACASGQTGCEGTPALPPGLSFDASTRTLSGTPTATGTTTLTYTVTDADDNTADTDTGTLSFDITVNANQVPTAHAGDAQTVAEGDTVTLDGSGSTDPEEQTLTYTWTPPEGITLSDDTAAMPTFDAPEVDGDDDYTFTLIVNDGVQDSAATSVAITVTDDTAPSFGTETVDDQTAVAHIAIEELVLPAATGGNGDLSYVLACATGATGCTGTPALPPGLSFAADDRELTGTPDTPGTYSMEYTATDADDNVTASDAATLTFDITVGANQVPTAHAGDAQTVAEGDTVTLDGSGSTDPEEQPLTYEWTALDGITLSDAMAAQPTFDAPEVDGENDYTFTLTVNDGVQDSVAASVTVTVEDDVAPSLETEVDDQIAVSHIAMEALELPEATGGNGDLSYALACASEATGCTGTPALPPGLSFDVLTRTLSGTPTATGTTTLTYTVTDADDNTADTDADSLDFEITVNANQAPTADAGAAQTVAEGDLVTLDGSGSTDPEEQPLTYTWTAQDGITLSSPTAAKPTFDAPEVDGEDDYTFTLIVNDGVQDSAPASVTITVKDDVAPSFGTATVDDQTAVTYIAMEALELPAATGGNGTLTYALACAAAATGCEGTPALPSGISFDASTRTLSGTPTATGTTTLTYTVTDADDNDADTDTGTLSFDITVNANQVPTADAGVDRTVAERDTVTLDGSGSTDPEGQALTYAWTAPSGSGITLSSPAAAKPTFDAPEVHGEADYTFTLTVNDGVQDSAAASVTITVKDDAAPSFGGESVDDQTAVAHIAMEDLELPAATGGNGELSYALACALGQTDCEGTPALPPGLSFDASTRTLDGIPTATGTTTLTYTVTDADDNNADTDTGTLDFDITVSANQAPTANAGDAQTVAENDRVTLDGSGSSDPEGQTLTYAWTAPSGSGITLSNPTTAKPTFDAPAVGSDGAEYEFTLIVNDGVQASAAASVTITVEDDTAPSFGTDVDDQTAVAHIAVEVLLPAATGGNGDLSYALACAAGATGCTGTPALPPGLSFDAATRTLSGTPTATGTTALIYTVTDADDNAADTDTGTLSFNIAVSANQVPTADAGAAQTVTEGDLVTLDGSGSTDPERQTLTYAWTVPLGSGITLSSTTAAKPTFTAPTLSADTPYTFTLTVNDGAQASAAASVTITVEDDTAPSFGTETVDDQTEVADIAVEALVLPAATGGNGTLSYALTCASGATGCTGTPALPPGLSFAADDRELTGTPDTPGTYSMEYTASDADDNVTASDAARLTFDITVNANQAPTADAGAAQTVAEGDRVTLDGSGSSDPEEQNLAYAWTAPSGIMLSSPTAAKPTFDAPEVGGEDDYTFTLVVNDGVQDSAAASVTITVEDDTTPSFGTVVDNRTEVAHIAMADLVLPLATGGNGTLTYALACASGATGCTGTPALPPGLSFDVSTRTLSGTPTATGTTTLTYTVTDADDNTAAADTGTLSFNIAVGANQAPTANAGVARTVTEGDTVTLDGSGSTDPEGQTLTYTWTAPSGSGITLSSTSVANPTFDAPEVSSDGAEHEFTLVVNDGVQNSAAARVTITVTDDTAPSFVMEVDDQTEVEHIAMEDLELPAATGGNGTLAYALACASGQTGCEGTPALPPGLSFDASTRTLSGTPTATGATTLTYRVTDADDNTADTDTGTLSFNITVGANQAPTADAGAAQTVTEGDTVTLDGSGSSDPEEQTLTYTWTAPSGSGITLSSPTAVKPTFDAPEVGSGGAEYEFTLTVNDGAQDSAAASVTITVTDDTAPSFGTETVDDQTEVEDIAMTDLVLPVATGGNGTLTYTLACASGATVCTGTPALPPGLSFDASTRTLSGTPTATGTTTLTYTVTDADDNTADTDTGTLSFDITVHANQAPTAHAGAAQTVAEGDQVILDGSGSSDPENQELTYTWTTLSGITLSSPSAAKPTFTAPDVTGETDYTFTLTVNDGVQDSAAASVTITVKDDTAPSFGTETVDDQTEVVHIAMAELVLPVATGGNGTLRYALACASGVTGCTGTPALPPGLSFAAADRKLTGTPDTPGTYSMEYTATDADDNVTTSDAATLTFDITVGANQAPTAHAGDAQTVTEGDTVTLDGSGSSDPEGQTLTYAWTAPSGSGITLSSTTEVEPTFTAPTVSADTPYTFALTVNDGVQASAEASVTVTVENDASPSFPAEPVADQLYVKGKAISTLTLPELTLGNGVNADHDYAWAPELPDGLTLDSANPASLTMSGVPTAASGQTTYTLTVSDRDGDTATVSVNITVEDNKEPSFAAEPLADQLYVTGKAISTLTLPQLTLGNGANTDHDYAWAPVLPAGLTLDDADPASLTVSGTPTAASSQTTYTLTVTDVDGDTASVSVKITVEGASSKTFAEPTAPDQLYVKDFPITALDLPQLTLGNGANADHDYKWAPALPPGLTPNHDDPASLSVSGVPTAASDEETYTLTVSDRDGDPASVSVKITVEEDMVPRFAPWDEAAQLYLKDASITPFRLPVLTPGNGDHTYAWDKALPAGLTFDDGDPANLTVSGTPTAVSPQTPYTLTVTDMDEDAVTLVVRIEVTDDQTRAVTTAGLVVTKSRVDVPENGDAEFGLRLSTAPTHDVTVALERSSEGDEDLRIREGASLTFTAATWETAQTVTLEAQDDADKVHGTATFLATSTSDDPNYDGRTVEVEATEVDDDAPRPPPPPVPVALPLAFAGSVNDLVYTEGKEIPGLVLPQANGGTAPLAYELAPLPSGLVFDGDPAIRRLAGTPDRPGSTPLSYTVTDAAGDAATLAFRIVVEEDLAPLFDPGMVADLKPQNYVAGNAVHLRLPLLTLGNGTNGDHSYEWSGKNGQTLALPVGLSLEGGPASLAITGTPTERMVSTEYTLTVTDRDGDATRLTLHIAVLEITEKPPGSEVTFDEETGEIMLRNVRFALADGPERTWDAARIKLPAGHMVTGLALRVANLADDEAMPPDPGTLFGGVALVISPTGGLAGRTASVCLSTDGLPQGKAPRLYHEEPASGVWKRVDTEMRGDAGLVCGDVSSFSRFRAGYEAESLMQVRERALEHMLAAFGRTVATDAVSVLSGRMVDVSQGGTGSRFTLAGRTPGSRGTVPGHDGMTIRTGSDRATAARNDGDWLGTGRGEPDLWADRTGSVTAISDRELLTGTSFQLALGEENGGAGGHATLWGKGRTAGFRGISAEGFALDGDVVSGWLGIDWRRSDLLLGLALSHSQGEMDYEDLDAINRDFSAQVKADLTGVYPYARLSLDDDLDVWGIAGVGAGGLTLADGFGGNETDIDMGMAAAGARRALGSWSLRDIDFAVKGDALSVMMRSDPRGLASPDSGDDLPEVNVSAQRVRLALEGGHTRTLESGGLVQSTLELGARYDRGGAETGAGVDLAGAVRYEDLSRGLTVEGRGRLLLAHEAEGFEEWGVGGTIRLSPGASGLGYSFSMEPSWGAAASGAGRLWNDRVTTGADTAARRRRLAAEFGYGLGVFGGQGVLTPHVAASLADGDGQDYRVGARLRLGLDLRVDVGVHHLEGGDGEAELGIGLQLSSGF